MIKETTIALLLGVLVLSCESNTYEPERQFEDIQQQLLSQFILAEDSTVIELPEGQFIFNNSLILDGKKHVTIRGKGMDRTVLSFKGQQEGAEGIRVANCTAITIEDLAIEDAAGDNIKITDTDGVTIRRVRSAWTGKVSEKNGAYGLYPVICKNVLIEDCEVLGASDAGIYVGQSEDVIIRNNKTWWNVAGIESENSENVEIYGNTAYNNTGGILVFDLPGLTRYGKNIRVYNNEVYENNLANFAPPGNIVGVVPKGTGMIVLATEGVEVYNNKIRDNKTIGVAIISYELVAAISAEGEASEGEGSAQTVNNNYKEDKNYNPFPRRIYVHDNEISSSYILPALNNDFGKLFLFNFGFSLPDIAWDGIRAPEYFAEDGTVNPEYMICIQEGEGVKTTDLDAANDFDKLETNPDIFKCKP
ncbi:hypothetical protein C900_00324 [Fulvivirga imtechensis AK7]|uniref:Right handed beta helix domain-containing protein n=1 Tax=Fulvivirga imtechensis AK7 TaxID=1237149 RepID=L8JI40_9BACT|nr:parallel beta-helix domain-containing protein [Fulvivirga imtechensis]ELR68490.1 hypothetical protein C900_00324 [Fulvivirga imtechensis AK7]